MYIIKLRGFILSGVAHAQHPVCEMSVVTKGAMSSQKLLIVPGLQKLLEEIVPVQAFVEQTKRPQTNKRKYKLQFKHCCFFDPQPLTP